MVAIHVSETWHTTYPEAFVGILAMCDVTNPPCHELLEARKDHLEGTLRDRLAGAGRAEIKALPTIQAYNAFYRRFRKTYHVQLQLESVALKGKPIPSVAALVEAMYIAEIRNQLLTAGHDLDTVEMPVRIDVADGSERFVRMNGQEQQLKQGDMFIRDAQGILSSVVYGPDRRTQITSRTRRALFTVYAPSGIEEQAVRAHLHEIRDNVLLVSPEAEVLELGLYR